MIYSGLMESMSPTLLALTLGLALHVGTAQAAAITIACEDNLPPFSSGPSGQEHGIVVEIIRQITQDLGLSDAIHLFPWSRVYAMGQNQPNTLVCAMARTPERENLFQWVGEVIHSPPVLLMLADNRQHLPTDGRLDDYRRYTIGVLRGSYQEKYLLAHGFTALEPFASYTQGYQMLRAGRIDLWAANQLTAISTVRQLQDDPARLLQTAFVFRELPQGMSMAFSLGTPRATVDAFRKALEAIKRDGRYQKILSQNG
ncbi:hypothetical protein EAY64_00775 [Aquitalea palustris]|uniref:Solute-binding protein family 3/N-terminal domain-containing protein n=2 Tax=Aquitalea palustris TaxID=2480983 RepID=A0A454JNU2_9NEIS|nr:hypothetical protein EAY64_00775 [Aquitalea palustris]